MVAAALPHETALPDVVREEWRQTWRVFGVDPAIAESVVWPEMLRYSVVRDFAETAVDFGFYFIGEKEPDYSIGIFQMRPSFVEALEKAWMHSGLADEYDLSFDIADSAYSRGKRIGRMNSYEWQVLYLGVFLRLLYHCYNLQDLPVEDQVRLSATAYNRGCAWTAAGCGDVDKLRKHAGASYANRAWEHYKSIAE